MPRTKEVWLDGITAVLVCCALVLVVVVARREFWPHTVSARRLEVREQKDWREYATDGHSMGSSAARVTVVEFADFECPACRMLATELNSIRARDSSATHVIYRHFPLSIHRFAIPAARASECASAQGAFEEMHNVLFLYSDSLGLAPWSWFAAKAHVPDTVGFAMCVRQSGPIAALARDTLAGRRLQISGTPTVIINGLRFTGTPPIDTLRAIIERARRIVTAAK